MSTKPVIADMQCKTYGTAHGLWQYDYGQILRIQGLNLPTAVEIHFSLRETGGESVTRVGVTRDGVTDVVIPDSMLENGNITSDYYIYAFIYLTNESSGETTHKIRMKVQTRPRPEAFDTPEDAELFRGAIAAVNEAADRAGVSEENAAVSEQKTEEHLEAVDVLAKQVAEKTDKVEELTQKAESIAEQLAEKTDKVEELTQKTEINKNDISQLSGEIESMGYKNLANVDLIHGSYVSASNGNDGSNAMFKRTDFVQVDSNIKQLKVLNTFHYGDDGIAFYNENKKYLGGFSDRNLFGNYIILNIPENTKYFKISGFTTDTLEVYYHNIFENLSAKLNSFINELVFNRLIANIENIIPGGTGSLNNGVFTQTHTGNGNNWWLIEIDLPLKNIIRIDCNITEIAGSVLPYIFGTKTNGSSLIMPVYEEIKASGNYIFDLDFNYYSVYNNVDLTKPISIGFANFTPELKCVYDRINIYSVDSELDKGKTLIENLNDMLLTIETNKNEITVLKSGSKDLISPNGSKFILQVSDSGEFVATPKIPSKILYIGNSLLSGFGFGMAASNSSEDYYYKVNTYLENKGKVLTSNKLSGTDYECTTNENDQNVWLNNTLLQYLNNDLELVIIQLGDNVNTDARVTAFESGTKKLIRFIRQHAPKARVAWVGEWYSTTTKQLYISNACAECGAVFIDISDLQRVSGNQANIGDIITRDDGTTFTIDNSGVASHPSDKGMTAIANRIIENLFE